MKINKRQCLLLAPEIVKLIAISTGTMPNKIHAVAFPKQVLIAANLGAWLESDVQKWMQE